MNCKCCIFAQRMLNIAPSRARFQHIRGFDEPAGEAERRDGRTESPGSDGLGGDDEQLKHQAEETILAELILT